MLREIQSEVAKLMEPIQRTVTEVKEQNIAQSIIITANVAKLDKIAETNLVAERWRRSLWGNGSGGPPGFLEAARAEDKAKLDQLFAMVGDLRAQALREEGKTDLRREQQENLMELEAASDTRRTNKLNRAHLWIGIVATMFGAWLLTLIRPVAHMIVDLLTKILN